MQIAEITEETIKWLFIQRATGLLYLAICVCVLYDYLTTLDEEIELVWNRPRWSLVQFMYMTNRYFGIVFQIYSAYAYTKYIVTGTNEVGPIYHIVSGYFLSLAILCMQGIMIFRVSSMYNHNRRIIALLGGALLVECIIVLVIQLASYSPKIPISSPAPGVVMCVQKSFPKWMYIFWFPIIFFESLVFGLSFSLALVYYKSLQHMANLNRVSIKSCFHKLDSLAYILLRDSITFPFIAVTVCIVNLIVWYNLPHLCIQMAFAFAGFALCILGPRLVLNLRGAYYQPFDRECEHMDVLDAAEEEEDQADFLFVVDDSNQGSTKP